MDCQSRQRAETSQYICFQQYGSSYRQRAETSQYITDFLLEKNMYILKL
jgi:hypothetical protein